MSKVLILAFSCCFVNSSFSIQYVSNFFFKLYSFLKILALLSANFSNCLANFNTVLVPLASDLLI